MSLRFEKRVKIAPGLHLNISKRGLSTSFGRRGASVTLSHRGLYGNVGFPGSGLSYRTKLDKAMSQYLNISAQKNAKHPPKNVTLSFDKKLYSFVFVDEDGQRISPAIEKYIKREFNEDIQRIYEQKEQEMNDDTAKLLTLHKETMQAHSPDQLRKLARSTISFDLQMPNEKEIYEEVKIECEEKLSFFENLNLLFPAARTEFLQKVRKAAQEQYEHELNLFEQGKEDYEEAKRQRLAKVEKVIQGDIISMELWLEVFLTELDFPLETNVSFQVLSPNTVCLDVNLPQIEEIPLTKVEILKSGKLKVHKKSQREMREHYAIMVGGTALYLCSYVFSLLPTCETMIISGYTQVKNKVTGRLDDQYIYSLKVNKNIFYSLNISEVHPIAVFENFQPIINITKTFIFREITPHELIETEKKG